jgi:hypothetical protein
MTEGDRAFFTRRKREELAKAHVALTPALRNLHLGWAQLYEARLNGEPKHVVRRREMALQQAGGTPHNSPPAAKHAAA